MVSGKKYICLVYAILLWEEVLARNHRTECITEDDGFLPPKDGFATIAIHAGQEPEKWNSSAVIPPIVVSSAFKQTDPGERGKFLYGRSGNPTRFALEECFAALEGGTNGYAFSSGQGAITTILSLLSKGDHIITSYDVYGGTSQLLRKVVERFGIQVNFTDYTNITNLEKAIKPNTKMIWVETPTNPLMKIVDIAATVKVAKKAGNITVVVDNTFSSPYLQRPLDFGADIVMHSMTKYMNGHSDVVMGAAVVKDPEIAKKLKFLQTVMGVVPSPFDCYLVNRGIKTLAVRMKQHKKSSLKIAHWLLQHPNVTKVMHPGLKTHPGHDIAQRQTSGHSGVLSFYHSGKLRESKIFFSSLKIFTLAVSLGGFESLTELPFLMSHASIPEHELIEIGISESLIRLSVGLEDVEDLIEDLDQALKKAFDPFSPK